MAGTGSRPSVSGPTACVPIIQASCRRDGRLASCRRPQAPCSRRQLLQRPQWNTSARQLSADLLRTERSQAEWDADVASCGPAGHVDSAASPPDVAVALRNRMKINLMRSSSTAMIGAQHHGYEIAALFNSLRPDNITSCPHRESRCCGDRVAPAASQFTSRFNGCFAMAAAAHEGPFPGIEISGAIAASPALPACAAGRPVPDNGRWRGDLHCPTATMVTAEG